MTCPRVHRMLAIALTALCLLGCDKAPNGVIPESKMDDLQVDLFKAEAYMDLHPGEFSNDSLKMILKQSVLAKHGFTLADYDRSIEWYAHNMDSYGKVYDKAIRTLDGERKDLRKESEKETQHRAADIAQSRLGYYPSEGDSADVWKFDRTWTLASNLGEGYINFEIEPAKDSQNGDRYQLKLKKLGFGSRFTLLLAADYMDGCTSLTTRNSSYDGWDEMTLQCDSTRSLRRLYGYIKYDVRPFTMAYVDSVSMLRTRCNKGQYSSFNLQKFITKKKYQ
ncbi:MAG: DUF4296 domain-containing protein [Muribaculaceae bacterium]|nr:DUF4296 domain-containing protein [Muribaculaceae bacterium]